jgi:hypothetical protein
MKNSILLCLFGAVAFGQQFQNTYGFMSINSMTAGSLAQSAAATWYTTGLMPWTSATLSNPEFYAASSTGSPTTSGDVTLWVCPDVGGSPGTCPSPIATSSTIASATAPGMIAFTGISVALTAYTQYWLVVTNSSSGGTKYFSWRYYTSVPPNMIAGGFTGQQVKTSTNSGSTWTTSNNSVAAFRVQLGSSYAGLPLVTSAVNAVTNQKLYSSHTWGPTFTMPPHVSMNMKGCGFAYLTVGTPTGNLECQVWSDNGTTATLVATSNLVLSSAQVDTSVRFGALLFTTSVPLVGGTTYHIALINTAADSSSNYYNANMFTVDSDVNSLGILPFGGTLKGAYCLGTCTTSSNWVTTYDIPIFSIMLDPGGEFNSTGGGTAVQRISGYVK